MSPADGGEADEGRTADVRPPSSTAGTTGLEDEEREFTVVVDARNSGRFRQAGATAHPWRWVAIAGVVVLLIAILFVLLRLV